MISLTQIVLSNNKLASINSKFSNITFKINRTGTSYVSCYTDFFRKNLYPDIIYLKGDNQSIIKYNYDFNRTDNLVQLIWYNHIDNCGSLFRVCSNITEIDLSYFNTSKVTNSFAMFYSCSSLSSLNLSNFDNQQL